MLPFQSSGALMLQQASESYGNEELRDDMISADDQSELQKRTSTVSQGNFSKYLKNSSTVEL